MAITNEFVRHILRWTLPGGEVANCSVHWSTGGTLSVGDPERTAFHDKAHALWEDIKANWSNEVNFVGSTLQLVSPTGTVDDTWVLGDGPTGGGDSNPTLPTEVAVCVSLGTDSGTRSGRGRIYLPAVARSASSTAGRLDHTSRDDIANGMQTYLSSMTVGGEDFFSVVYSRSVPILRAITGLRVGDVFDSQRRRRDALVEDYKALSVT